MENVAKPSAVEAAVAAAIADTNMKAPHVHLVIAKNTNVVLVLAIVINIITFQSENFSYRQ